jgi:tRNA(Glu) U13 pseudouridine synthase TruD
MDNISHEDKLKALGLDPTDKINKVILDKLYKNHLLKEEQIKKEITEKLKEDKKKKEDAEKNERKEEKVIDTTSEKYKILLKLVNQILTNINKPNITKLTEFKDIDREDLIKDIHDESFRALEYKIYDHFDKGASGWYRRKSVKAYILTFLKYACNDINLLFRADSRSVQEVIDGKSFSRTHTFYSIL